MKKDYIIVAPSIVENHKSNGIRALHLLYEALEKKGYTVYLYSPFPHSSDYEYIDEISEYHKKNSVVVYPEIVKGNPLRFQNVVRYVLNKPGYLGGEKKYHKSETIFTWSTNFYPDVPVLLIPYIDKEIFYNDNTPKTHSCVFVHKNGRFREIPELGDLIEINMSYPKTREELGKLLRSAEYLYTFDNCTAIVKEAHACGAKIRIITQDGYIELEKFDDFSDELFTERLENFIKITQSLDYKGKIQPPCYFSQTYSLLAMLYHKLKNNKQKYKRYKNLFLYFVK